MHIDELLRKMMEQGASDLHLKVGQPPVIRIHGKLYSMEMAPFTQETLSNMLMAIIPPQMVSRFEEDRDLDFSYQVESGPRFRVNMFYQKGNTGAVFRQIPTDIPTLE
ncbi:MAG: type IV pili twitching motility protein PilT, partial [Candidatus Eremiobacteraeota bacterium]|nr:type IV pili twitching motility protein PilT [Candidatus Eremiobacteraeota bacterium]